MADVLWRVCSWQIAGCTSEVVAETLDAVYNSDLDDDDWALTDLESTPGVTVAVRAREIHESVRCIQQARWEARVEVPQNLLELLSSLAKWPISAPSQVITAIVEPLKAQHIALHEKVGRSRERLIAHESKLFSKLNNAETKAAELKTSLYGSVARVRCLEGGLRVSKPLRLKNEMSLVELLLISPPS